MRAINLFVVLAVAAAPNARAAPPVRPALPTMCRIEGWSIDPDPTGLRVRSGPSASAPEIGRLPSFVRDQDGDYGPGFAITAATKGWLRIEHARDAWRPSELPRRPTFAGSGWVHGSRVRVAVQSGAGHALPGARTPIVIDLGDNWLTEVGVVTTVLDCSGNWARVGYAVPATQKARGPRNGTAWFTRICGDQRTTCDLPQAR